MTDKCDLHCFEPVLGLSVFTYVRSCMICGHTEIRDKMEEWKILYAKLGTDEKTE